MSQKSIQCTTIINWIDVGDDSSILNWLELGNPKRELVVAAITHSLKVGRVDIAQKAWDAASPDPTTTIKEGWSGILWISGYHNLDSLRSQEDREKPLDLTLIRPSVDWLLEKSLSSTVDLRDSVRNSFVFEGLRWAYILDDERLWDDILALRPDGKKACARDVLSSLVITSPHWYSKSRQSIPDTWRTRRLLPDMLSLGVVPGGSFWVGCAYHVNAEHLFKTIAPLAKKLTRPRQRLAILVYANHLKVRRLDQLIEAFLLPLPSRGTLSPSEKNKAQVPYGYHSFYLSDVGREEGYVGFDRTHPPAFLNPQLTILDAGEAGSLFLKNKLTVVSEASSGIARADVLPTKPKM